MDNPSGVAVVDAVAELVDEEFGLVGAEGVLVLLHVLLEVVIYKFKDEVEFLFGRLVNHFSECYDVGVGL